jgi:hypothetical protein
MRGWERLAPLFWGYLVFFSGEALALEVPTEPITHGELARQVCLISGLSDAAALAPEVAIELADRQGWTPLGGWRHGAYATREDFYVVMCKYLGLPIGGPADRAASYYQALVAEGYLAGAVPAEGVSTDPAPPALDGEVPRFGTALTMEAERIVLEVQGDVEVRSGPDGAWRPLASYDPIMEGMEIRTGAGGQAHLAYVGGISQIIQPDSRLQVKTLRSAAHAAEVTVEIENGTVFSVVPPLPEGSKFSVADALGVIEVDPLEGCELRSVVEKSEVFSLKPHERKFALGNAALAPIEPCRSHHSNFRGRAFFKHLKAKVEIVRSGESVYFHVAGWRIGPVDHCNFAELRSALNRLKKLARDHLLTESEIRAFLANLGAGGLCDIHVTPIGR